MTQMIETHSHGETNIQYTQTPDFMKGMCS